MGKVRSYRVENCNRSEVVDFIEKWHYSHNMNGVLTDYCFRLLDERDMIGAMVFGRLAMANVWKKYAEKKEDITELRRLCCIDDTPKNTESYFIGAALRWLGNNTNLRKVLSYADTFYGHEGIIYKASNFEHLGMTSDSRVIIYRGKMYHDKTIRTKYKGKLKPFAKRIKDALETEEAYYQKRPGKHIYLYELRKPKRKPIDLVDYFFKEKSDD